MFPAVTLFDLYSMHFKFVLDICICNLCLYVSLGVNDVIELVVANYNGSCTSVRCAAQWSLALFCTDESDAT